MEKIILKSLAVFVLIFSLTACSQKTTTPSSTTQNSSVNEQANRRGERGENRERPEFSDLLAKMDANKDGRLAVIEIDGRLKEMAPQIDTNQDGFITEEEFKNAPKPQRGGRGRN